MKTFSTLVAATAVFSTAYGASVKIEETPCLQNQTELKTFDVEIGTLKVGEIESVCGLKIVSADGADLASVSCQAFKDAEGKSPGSAIFTSKTPALIATNPVQEGSIKCSLSGDSSSDTTTTTLLTASPSGTGYTSMPTGNSTSGNGTVGPTGTPTQPGSPSGSPTGPAENPNSAGRVGLSIGALAVGVAALVL